MVRVISSESLEQRADAAMQMENLARGYSTTFTPTEKACPECGILFWTGLRMKIYCSSREEPFCSKIAFRKQAKERQRVKREKRKQTR